MTCIQHIERGPFCGPDCDQLTKANPWFDNYREPLPEPEPRKAKGKAKKILVRGGTTTVTKR